MLSVSNIKERIQSIIQLPTLPTVAMEVVDVIEDPHTSAAVLGRIISTDQALTGKVLKIANSSFYGFPKRISTIDFAIIVLGFNVLKEIVVSIALVNALQKKSDSCFDSQIFWDHSIQTGIIAKRLSRDRGYRISGEAYVAGLLHDMGISIMHKHFASEFARIIDLTRDSNLTFREAEESVMGVTHSEVGGWLAEHWNFPEHLVESIFRHHEPSKAEMNADLVALIHCADVMASRLCPSPIDFEKGIEFDQSALERLGLGDPQVLEEHIARYQKTIHEDVEEVRGVIS